MSAPRSVARAAVDNLAMVGRILPALATCGWRTCPQCPPDDNVWPETCFWKKTASCKACYTERYGARKREQERKRASRRARRTRLLEYFASRQAA